MKYDDIYMRTPLDMDQVGDMQHCFQTWLAIRAQNGYDKPPTYADVVKSCLLGRMFIDGKPPLDDPPPTMHSAPWYDLIENNGADLHGAFVFYNPGRLNIGGQIWTIDRTLVKGYVVSHPRVTGVWVLRRRTVDDPQVKAGSKLSTVTNRWEPYYFGHEDWILEGPGGIERKD